MGCIFFNREIEDPTPMYANLGISTIDGPWLQIYQLVFRSQPCAMINSLLIGEYMENYDNMYDGNMRIV